MSIQNRDLLRYNGKIYQLKSATLADLFSDKRDRSSPLAPLLESNDFMQYFTSPYLSFHSGNTRGYRCDWEIKDNQLFLKSFASRSTMLHSIDQLLGKTPPALALLDEAEAPYVSDYSEEDLVTIFADWFSGLLDAEEHEDYGEGTVMNGIRFQIEKGTVIDSTPCNIRPRRARPLKNYIED